MVEEPWAALDLDDSDIPSLLRPCKRRRPSNSSVAAVNPPPPPLSPKEHHAEQDQPPSRRAIPGPAGAVQAAMHRKDIDRRNLNISENQDDNCQGFNGNYIHNDGVISTQEYVQRAMEDTAEFDDDFNRNPWLSALHFLGAENCLPPSTPISSIKKLVNSEKVDQVVAVVKSCTPNGLGGFMVLLKDPTGTVGASIHHEVLSQVEFGKNLTVGAVLILREVAIFSPVRSAHYLNITRRNLVKLFCQDGGSTSKPCNSTNPVQNADPVHCGKAKTVGLASTTQKVPCEDTEKSQTENSQNHSAIQRQHLYSRSSQSNNRGSAYMSSTSRGDINSSQHACSEIPVNIAGDHEEIAIGSEKYAKGGHLECSVNTDGVNNSLTNCGGEDVQEQRQPLASKASLPQWTDEQLDQLFTGDDDDDVSL